MSEPTILIATNNRGKLREIRSVLHDLPVRWQTLDDVGMPPAPVEDGDTFLANATIKAFHYARLTGLWTLADDSGLAVDALGGRPGVHSARFAGPIATDAQNNAKLIELLHQVTDRQRTAKFCCAAVLVDPDHLLAQSQGYLEGLIVTSPRGANGFGYDPHFLIPHLGKTAAELTPDQKNAISHRGQALRAIRGQIESLFRQ